MLINLHDITVKYLLQATAELNGIIGNPFWKTDKCVLATEYVAGLAVAYWPVWYIKLNYTSRYPLEQLLLRGIKDNESNFLFLIKRLVNFGHQQYVVNVVAPKLKYIRKEQPRSFFMEVIKVITSCNSLFVFKVCKVFDDELIYYLIDRLPHEIRFRIPLICAYKIITKKKEWLDYFISYYRKICIRILEQRKHNRNDSAYTCRLITSMIDDLTDVVGEVNSYIIGKLEVFITPGEIPIFANKMASLMKSKLASTYGNKMMIH